MPDAFEAATSKWRVTKYDGWSRFDEVMKPDEYDRTWRFDIDLILSLEKHGADFNKEHEIEHCFMGTPAQLQRIKDALEPRGFIVCEREDGELVLKRPLRIVGHDITETTVPLRRLAREVGATYDGWATVIVR